MCPPRRALAIGLSLVVTPEAPGWGRQTEIYYNELLEEGLAALPSARHLGPGSPSSAF